MQRTSRQHRASYSSSCVALAPSHVRRASASGRCILPAPVLSCVTPASTEVRIAIVSDSVHLSRADRDQRAAPVDEYTAPAPAIPCAALAPSGVRRASVGGGVLAPRPVVIAVLAHVDEYIAPAPATSFWTCSSFDVHHASVSGGVYRANASRFRRDTSCFTYAAPSSVVEYIALMLVVIAIGKNCLPCLGPHTKLADRCAGLVFNGVQACGGGTWLWSRVRRTSVRSKAQRRKHAVDSTAGPFLRRSCFETSATI